MPTRRATAIATKIGTPTDISLATVTAAIAAVGPTDRSMPPAMMTRVMPERDAGVDRGLLQDVEDVRRSQEIGARSENTTMIRQADHRAGIADSDGQSETSAGVVHGSAMISTMSLDA